MARAGVQAPTCDFLDGVRQSPDIHVHIYISAVACAVHVSRSYLASALVFSVDWQSSVCSTYFAAVCEGFFRTRGDRRGLFQRQTDSASYGQEQRLFRQLALFAACQSINRSRRHGRHRVQVAVKIVLAYDIASHEWIFREDDAVIV